MLRTAGSADADRARQRPALSEEALSVRVLQTFEQDAGQTNKSRVRIELNAQVGVERQAAAVRIAAS
jgi:hypothetical protein